MVYLLVMWRRASVVLSESMKRASMITRSYPGQRPHTLRERVDEGEDGSGQLLDQRRKTADDLLTETDDLDHIPGAWAAGAARD